MQLLEGLLTQIALLNYAPLTRYKNLTTETPFPRPDSYFVLRSIFSHNNSEIIRAFSKALLRENEMKTFPCGLIKALKRNFYYDANHKTCRFINTTLTLKINALMDLGKWILSFI